MSRRFVNLEARGYFKDLHRRVLRRQFHGQAFPAFLAATTQDFTSPSCFHARPEPMSPDATLVAGTVCWLAHLEISQEPLADYHKEGEG
jgi:hypothetical protein